MFSNEPYIPLQVISENITFEITWPDIIKNMKNSGSQSLTACMVARNGEETAYISMMGKDGIENMFPSSPPSIGNVKKLLNNVDAIKQDFPEDYKFLIRKNKTRTCSWFMVTISEDTSLVLQEALQEAA